MFEPSLRKFDYGDDRIEVSTMRRDQGGGAFFGIKKSTADLLSDEVSVWVCRGGRWLSRAGASRTCSWRL
jgi:hypothetical protein